MPRRCGWPRLSKPCCFCCAQTLRFIKKAHDYGILRDSDTTRAVLEVLEDFKEITYGLPAYVATRVDAVCGVAVVPRRVDAAGVGVGGQSSTPRPSEAV